MLMMEELYQSKAVLVIGNDPTNQNPLGSVADSLGHQALWHETFHYQCQRDQAGAQGHAICKVAAGHEGDAVRWLAHGEGNLAPEMVEQLMGMKAALEAQSDVAIVFGEEISGAAIAQAGEFRLEVAG